MAKVLVIDDDSHFRGIIERIILRSYTYSVKSVAGEKEAWEDLSKDTYDLVMLDLYIDGKKSWDTLKRIKALPSAPVVIMISCEDLAENAEYSKALGAVDFVPKPIDFARLKSSVDAALQLRSEARFSRRAGDGGGGGDQDDVLGLLVFGDREVRSAVATALSSSRFRLYETEDPGSAAEAVRKKKPDAVLARIDGDAGPAKDLIALLRAQEPGMLRLPVIAITDSDPDGILGALKAGADDYLSQPIDPRILAAKVEAHIRFRREHELKVRQAAANALTDAITGLYTPAHVRVRLEEEVRRSVRYKRDLALAVLKVSENAAMKVPEAWDRILAEASRVLREALRVSDVVGRWGEDGFAIILPDATADRVCPRAETIRARVEERVSELGGETADLACYVGLASLPQRFGRGTAPGISVSAEGLLGMVDAARARAELSKGGRVQIFGAGSSRGMRTDE